MMIRTASAFRRDAWRCALWRSSRPSATKLSTALNPSSGGGLWFGAPVVTASPTPSKFREPSAFSSGTSSRNTDFAPSTRPPTGPADSRHSTRAVLRERMLFGVSTTCGGLI